MIPTLEVYVDILFLLNLIMDYFIFWMVSKIIHQKVQKRKLLLGASMAALLYCLVATIPFLKVINLSFYLVLLPLIPIWIIFKPTNMKQLIQIFIVSNITAITVGGMSFGIYYWLKEQNILGYISSGKYKDFSIWTLIISVIISYLMIQSARYYLQKRNTSIQKLYSLKIYHNDTIIETQALLDTGNKVYDPITQYPVIIAEYKILASLLPEKMKKAYLESHNDISLLIKQGSNGDLPMRIIPYHSLGNPQGMLVGFKPDWVSICHDSTNWKSTQNIIIAIYQHDLHTEGIYHVLLHADLIDL